MGVKGGVERERMLGERGGAREEEGKMIEYLCRCTTSVKVQLLKAVTLQTTKPSCQAERFIRAM